MELIEDRVRALRVEEVAERLQREYDTEFLSQAELAAVERGLADIQAGRTVKWEDVKREHGL